MPWLDCPIQGVDTHLMKFQTPVRMWCTSCNDWFTVKETTSTEARVLQNA